MTDTERLEFLAKYAMTVLWNDDQTECYVSEFSPSMFKPHGMASWKNSYYSDMREAIDAAMYRVKVQLEDD